MSFRLRNATYYLDYPTFCIVFCLSPQAFSGKQPNNSRVPELWPKTSGNLVFPKHDIYTSVVYYPLLRMFFKFARETLFLSPSPHLVRNQEVFVLHYNLAPHPDTAISIPMTLWKFLNTIATLDVKTNLCFMGHVYRIAEYFNVYKV